MRTKFLFLFSFIVVCNSGCNKVYDIIEGIKDQPRIVEAKVFATGLVAPLGLETDSKGQLWVTEAGSGSANDGQLTVITPQGSSYTVVKGFSSVASPEGAIFGLNHLLLKDGTLYLLHGTEGRLYKFDVSTFKPGDAPRMAGELAYEDIGSFVKNQAFEDDNNETDLFNLTIGPGGDLFIADAAANAIIRRKSATGELSVFATIPPVANPPGDPAQVQAVPTGIVFDGSKFLVCTFTGYPYPAQQGTIYQVDLYGKTAVYQTGLNSLADIELGNDQKPVVVEYGTWTGETFASGSGKILQSVPGKNTPLLTNLNFPNSIERFGTNTYYVAQTFDGKIQKITIR